MNQDAEFDAVMRAVANFNRRRPRLSEEQRKAIELESHKKDPRHIKALKRRRKRKRGGPK